MKKKPGIPKGTRDFDSIQLYKRNYIIDVIKDNFLKFGFNPIETPSFEKSSTLLGKYGDEGDRLIFKILKSGDFLKDLDNQDLVASNKGKIASKISDKALRYDLTVPFARYVVQNQNEITLPFKRFQIQPVWRADKPQRGRFREFLQCDADVIGSQSLYQEIELIQLFDSIFDSLKLSGTRIKINNRKILVGLSEILDCKDKFKDLTTALDKKDKIGIESFGQELESKGFSKNSINTIIELINFSGDFKKYMTLLKSAFKDSLTGLEGVNDLEFIYSTIEDLGLKSCSLNFDLSLARGIDYYTGVIFEVSAPNTVSIGSIAGGGRYDNLTEIFGLSNLSGIGISFGLDRIYIVLDELDLFPVVTGSSVNVLFLNFGKENSFFSLEAISKLRENNISTELYPDPLSIKKQLGYANKNSIPYTVFVGDDELSKKRYSLKDMNSGSQELLTLTQLIKRLS